MSLTNPYEQSASFLSDSRCPFLRMGSSLENCHAVIKVHCEGRLRELRWRKSVAGVVGVKFIKHALAELDEGTQSAKTAFVFFPIGSVQVLNHVNAILRNARIQELESLDDVTHHVTSVVENDVRVTKLVKDTL